MSSIWCRMTPRCCPAIRVRRTGGHTLLHQIVYLESGGKTAVFAADLMPTTAHVDVPWIMGYDLYPMETLEFKRAFVSEAIEREYIVFFEHDPASPPGYIREKDRRLYVEPISEPRTAVNRRTQLETGTDMSEAITIGIIGGSGLYDMAELTDREERRVNTPFGDPSGPVPDRHAAREARGVSGAARRRAQADADRAQLPRQHLRVEVARRRVHPVGERRRVAAGATTCRSIWSFPISSSTARRGG